jgi:hypothetical protein
MKKELLEFLEEEISISKYKIITLDRGSKKTYKNRLLAIERDFLKFPFESLGIDDIDAFRKAVLMFKTDRELFDKVYNNNLDSKAPEAFIISTLNLNKRINFFKNLYKYLLENKIRKVNLIEESSLGGDRADGAELTGIDSIRKNEGALISKERARIQILIYCFARVIHKELSSIEAEIGLLKDGENKDIRVLKSRIDGLFDFGINNIFKHYNSGITEVPLLINGTMGHNDYVPCIYPLVNLTDSIDGNLSIDRVLGEDRNFFSKTGVRINKKFIKRGFSIVLPIPRVGNETMDLLYLDLFSSSGTRLNSIMTKSFYNIKVKEEYSKAIATVPIWEFPEKMNNLYLNREILSLLGLDSMPLIGSLDFLDKNIYMAVNNNNGSIKLNKKDSKILVAATRSETAHVNQAHFWIKLLIKEIKDDYESKFHIESIHDNSDNRKIKYQEFLRNK